MQVITHGNDYVKVDCVKRQVKYSINLPKSQRKADYFTLTAQLEWKMSLTKWQQAALWAVQLGNQAHRLVITNA